MASSPSAKTTRAIVVMVVGAMAPTGIRRDATDRTSGLERVSLSLLGCATTTKRLGALASSPVEHRYDLLRRLASHSVTAARSRAGIGRHVLELQPGVEREVREELGAGCPGAV